MTLEIPVIYLPSIAAFSIMFYVSVQRFRDSARRLSEPSPPKPVGFVEGGHYIVWYVTESGPKNRGYLIVDRISMDGRAILRRLSSDRTPAACGPPSSASWMGVAAYEIESVVCLPPPPEVGDKRGSYRGE